MHQNLAILIADLSGYTALTEIHGSISAADIIDKFVGIVERSLTGESILHQRVGDEVMIISASADNLLDTAIVMLQNCSKQKYFLQLHGGLHFGEVHVRNNSYFGSPINTASRIASEANKGSIWCSSAFIKELTTSSDFSFLPKGRRDFKNLSEPVEVFELESANIPTCYIDPVCRMVLHSKEDGIVHPGNEDIVFCSNECLTRHLKGNAV